MPAKPVEIAAAVVTVLNAGSYGAALEATRGYVLPVHLEKMPTTDPLKAWVMPAELEVDYEHHAADTETHTIHVAFVRKVASPDATIIDPLIAVVERVRDMFRNLELPGVDAVVVERRWSPIYDPQRLRKLRLFLSVLQLDVRAVREVA